MQFIAPSPSLGSGYDTFPSSLIDSNVNMKGKKTEEQGIRTHSLTRNISWVEGRVGVPGWD
jgi:hypothetical protein